MFGSANTNSLFGQNQNPTPSGLFGQTTANQPAIGGNLFASFGASAQPQQSQSLFGSTNENKSIFGQTTNNSSNIFATNPQQMNQQSSNIFANAMAQQQNSTPNVFGVQPEQPQQNNTQNVFGVQQEQPQSIFNQSNSNAGGSNIFQNQASGGGSIFGGNSGFGQVEQVSQSAYSKLEELKPEDLEWFRSDAFMFGRIPTVPPPQELCV